MKYLTLERLMSWYPCYTETEILKMFGGRKRIKIDEIFDLEISDADKIWILLHEPIFTVRELCLIAREFASDDTAARNDAWRAAWGAGETARQAAREAAWQAAREINRKADWEAAREADRKAAWKVDREAAWKDQLKIVKKHWEKK